MDGFLGPTQFTLDLTTPMEGARTPLHHDNLLRPVPAATTHQVTPVHADAGVVALAAVRPLDPQLGVALAEHRGGLQVHQVLDARRLVLGVVRLQLEVVLAPLAAGPPQTTRVAHHDPGGAVEAVLEVVPDHSEVGQAHPARLDSAGPGHSVTLAFLPHLGRHVLQHTSHCLDYNTQ